MLYSNICLVFLTILQSVKSLNVCSRRQACGAVLNSYPQMEDDSSGWGSGMGPPLYDELLSHDVFDYSQNPEAQQKELCLCQNNETCPFGDESKMLSIDRMITMTFCDDVSKQLSTVCPRYQNVARVIGAPHPNFPAGETLQSVSDTMVFCQCPGGYRKLSTVNYWGNGEIYFEYQCF